MYYDYYGLKQPPFRITPDTSLFFPGGDRGAILDALIYAIVSGEGIVKLVGEVGSGKTTLCRMLEKELPKNIEIVYLANPSLSPDNILHAIAFELGLQVEADTSRLKVMNALQNYLLEKHAENKQVVVFIEEAQSMPLATLEEIRLLSNLETAESKLLQIVIFGQPELDAMIAKQEIRQLKERITYSFYLSPLKPDEIRDYINSRLRACGYRSVELFNDKAIKAISHYSDGLLRRINILADKSMLASYAENMNTVTAKHVKLAAGETEFTADINPLSGMNWKLIFVSLLVLVIVGFSFPYVLQFWESSPRVNKEVAGTIKPIETVPQKTEENKVEIKVSGVKAKKMLDSEEVLPEQKPKTIESIADESLDEGKTVVEEAESSLQVVLPARTELDEAEWQKLNQSVYVYSEQAPVSDEVNEDIVTEPQVEPELLDIDNIAREVTGHTREELELLQQLEELPPEAAMNGKSVATDMTCKLCSTIIYRPLRDDSNL